MSPGAARRNVLPKVALVLAALLLPLAAHARKTDRDQPMDIDAGRQEGALDERAPTVLSQGVVITQGTLHIQSDRAEIHLRDGDISRTVLTGRPVQLRQEMDDGQPMNARAQTVDYDLSTDIVTLTGDAYIEQPRGTMAGQRIVYNMATGHVESGGQNAGRVQMRINPRNRQGGG